MQPGDGRARAARDAEDIAELKALIEEHLEYTGSAVAQRMLGDWDEALAKFVKVMPTDYKRVLRRRATSAMGVPETWTRSCKTAGGGVDNGKANWIQGVRARAVPYSDPLQRIDDWSEFTVDVPEEQLRDAGRALHGLRRAVLPVATGCPIDNLIPEWNDLVYRGRWREALDRCTRRTTSRSSPAASARRRAKAPACWASTSRRSRSRTSRARSSTRASRRAGSSPSRRTSAPARRWRSSARARGPRGRRAAQSRRAQRDGLRARRPDRRPADVRHPQHEARQERRRSTRRHHARRRRRVRHGRTSAATTTPRSCCADYDAIVLARGATRPRDLPIPGRELEGVHFAMEFLTREHQEPAGQQARGRRVHQRERQARDRHRRRRHRHRLHRHLDSPRLRARGELRAATRAAARARRRQPLAANGR